MNIYNTIYAFGSSDELKLYGRMIFCENGTIFGYRHENEFSYGLRNDGLIIYNIKGDVSIIFKRSGRCFLGKRTGCLKEFILVPIFSVNYNNSNKKEKILINTIPKSGTYFFERLLIDFGYGSTRLHLSGTDICDDYRGMNEEQMHKEPEKVRRFIPLRFISKIIQNGQVVLGHIHHKEIIDYFKVDGFYVVNIKRNLRDILVSMYRFKLAKVVPVDRDDIFWRSLPEEKRFMAFLSFIKHRDLVLIKNVADFVSKDFNCLNYEDILNNKTDKLEFICDLLEKNIGEVEEMIRLSSIKDTPTSSGCRSDWKNFWNEDVDLYFVENGLSDLNKKLGYE